MNAENLSACPACGSNATDGRTRVPDHEYGVEFVATYVRCSACGSETQAPMPEDEQLASFYPATYHSKQADGALVRMRNDVRWKRLASLLDPAGGKGVILDYGCGDGQFLRHVAERDASARLFGYEIGATREIIEQIDGRVTIVRGSVDDLLGALPPCRMITMNHVIEHLPDPVKTLSQLARHLEPGGVFEGQTPAAGSLEHRVFGTRWSGYHAPRHTVVFSPGGLESALERAGLTRPNVIGAFNPAGLALSLASVRHDDAPSVLRREGLPWLVWLGLASGLSLVDKLSGAPAVIDFDAKKAA